MNQENNLIITKLTRGLENRLVPFAMEFDVISNNSLYNTILEVSEFNKAKDNFVKSLDADFEGYTAAYFDKMKAYNERIKQLINSGNVKITIKIELEKYE